MQNELEILCRPSRSYLEAIRDPSYGMAPDPSHGTLYQINLPHATFGIVAHKGVVIRAAPLAAWTLGKRENDVISAYLRFFDRLPMPWIPLRILENRPCLG